MYKKIPAFLYIIHSLFFGLLLLAFYSRHLFKLVPIYGIVKKKLLVYFAAPTAFFTRIYDTRIENIVRKVNGGDQRCVNLHDDLAH